MLELIHNTLHGIQDYSSLYDCEVAYLNSIHPKSVIFYILDLKIPEYPSLV